MNQGELMFCITDEAAVLVKELQEKTASNNYVLALASAGVGCGAPVIKLEMKQSFDDDVIEEVSGFSIHIRSAILKFLPDAEITVEETFWGKKLKVKTIYGCK